MCRSVQTQMLSLFFRKNTVLQHNWSNVVFIIVTSSLFSFFFPQSVYQVLWQAAYRGSHERLQEDIILFITQSDVLLFTYGYLFSFYIMLLCFFALKLSLAHTCVLAHGLKETLSCECVEGKGWAAAVCCCQVV